MKSSFKIPALFAGVFAAFFMVIMVISNEKSQPVSAVPLVSTHESKATENTSQAESVSSHMYLAQIREDDLVIFELPDTENPIYISDISVASLTKTDYEKLKDGIYLDTKAEMSHLLEDFES